MGSRILRPVVITLLVLWAMPGRAADDANHGITVFAAASLTDALQELAEDFTRSTSIPVHTSFAASSALARQIEGGAPADVFFSADVDWMDYLQSRHLIKESTRRDLVGNKLVLIAPAASGVNLKIFPRFPLSATLGGERLATGDPDAVPVGRYARAALTSLGVWPQIENKLVRADNVRAALALVARGEVPLGIVYASDALVDGKVRVVDTFPEDSHPPIIYPIAMTVAARTEAARFIGYLAGPAGDAVFKKYGFIPIH